MNAIFDKDSLLLVRVWAVDLGLEKIQSLNNTSQISVVK